MPEAELRQIPVQVLPRGVLIDAPHVALEDAEVAFNRVRVDRALQRREVLILAMAHDAVAAELAADVEVVTGLVRHQAGFAGRVLPQDRREGRGLQVIDDHAKGAARLTVNEGHQLQLVMVGAPHGLAGFMADEGLIDLDGDALATERGKLTGAHGLADTVRQEPGRLVLDLQSAVQLVSGNALLAGGHQDDRLKPPRHGQLGLFEDRAHANGELAAALQAEADALLRVRLDRRDALDATAVRANGAVRPDDALNENEGGLLVVEAGEAENGHGVGFLVEP